MSSGAGFAAIIVVSSRIRWGVGSGGGKRPTSLKSQLGFIFQGQSLGRACRWDFGVDFENLEESRAGLVLAMGEGRGEI